MCGADDSVAATDDAEMTVDGDGEMMGTVDHDGHCPGFH